MSKPYCPAPGYPNAASRLRTGIVDSRVSADSTQNWYRLDVLMLNREACAVRPWVFFDTDIHGAVRAIAVAGIPRLLTLEHFVQAATNDARSGACGQPLGVSAPLIRYLPTAYARVSAVFPSLRGCRIA